MKISAILTLWATAAWLSPGFADWTDARCDIYPAGQDHTDIMIPCTFGQRQGYITLTRDDGVTHELSPVGDYVNATNRSAEARLEADTWIVEIDGAVESIDLQTFIQDLDAVGHQVRDHLLQVAGQDSGFLAEQDTVKQADLFSGVSD